MISPARVNSVTAYRPLPILGPPGCGKTTRLTSLLERAIWDGMSSDRIAVVTFTRAARLVVLRRVHEGLGLDGNACPWIRTIHAAAFRLLGCSKDRILSSRRWAEFAKAHGYVFSELDRGYDDIQEGRRDPPRRSTDDELRYVYGWGRNCRLDPVQTLARCRALRGSSSAFRLFVRRLETFKAQHGLLDYPDLLEEVLRQGLRPDVDVALIDEAQDLSPLQIAAVEAWFAPCERVYVAGDDDQAIYGFQGASPAWLREIAAATEPEVLGQSYRVPVAVHALAGKIIRQNKARVEKEYLPTAELGSVRVCDLDEAMHLVDGRVSTFVLARNRLYLRTPAVRLMEAGVPFVVEGDGAPNPLHDARILDAVRLARELSAGAPESISASALHALLRWVPSGGDVLPRGIKARVAKGVESGETFELRELLDELRLGKLIECLAHDGPLAPLTKLPLGVRRYVQGVLNRYGSVPDANVHLTSIHGSKGREADLVIVLSSMTRATWEEYQNGGAEGREAENRLFYVAVTRARHTLVLVRPRTRRHYAFPSFRVEEGAT